MFHQRVLDAFISNVLLEIVSYSLRVKCSRARNHVILRLWLTYLEVTYHFLSFYIHYLYLEDD